MHKQKRWMWFSAVVLVVLAALAGPWILRDIGQARAMDPIAEETLPSGDGASPTVQERRTFLRELRQELHLSNEDLAAMGLTQEAAEDMLSALSVWQASNDSQLDQSAIAVRRAERNVQKAWQRVSLGARNAGFQEAKAQLVSAEQSRAALLATAETAIASHLSAEQLQVWQATRSGKGFGEYRYLPDLSPRQLTELYSQIDAHDQASLDQAELFALDSIQREKLRQIRLNLKSQASAVAAAERAASAVSP